jgi:hypothetical protein
VRWRRADGPVRWDVVVEPAFHRFREERAPRFPLDEAATAAYPGRTVEELAVKGGASVGWRVTPRLEARLDVRGQHAIEFRELGGGVLLRYGFGG